MSHAALINGGLLCLTVLSVVVLVTFIYAAVRMPAETAGLPRPAVPEPPATAHRHGRDDLAQDWPQEQVAAFPGGAGGQFGDDSTGGPFGDDSYVARHAVSGGPPWGPAPKPPGVAE